MPFLSLMLVFLPVTFCLCVFFSVQTVANLIERRLFETKESKWVHHNCLSPDNLPWSTLKGVWLTHILCHRSVVDWFSAWLTGVCWRNRSELRPFWHLCRPAGPSLSSWQRSRRWSLLLKSNSWRPYGFISTSKSTKQQFPFLQGPVVRKWSNRIGSNLVNRLFKRGKKRILSP